MLISPRLAPFPAEMTLQNAPGEAIEGMEARG